VERTHGEQQEWQQSREGTESSQRDPDAFSATFTRFSPALYDFLARLSGRVEAAEALLRQSASQAAMSVASAPQWPSVRAWLFARAVALLPEGSNTANADPALFGELNSALLPASPPDSGLLDMARVVWRAVSALSTDQHALLHLHIRDKMVAGEAASVLGITEHEAAQRLNRVIVAVEETSRALFLIRYGRGHDPQLNELLADHNVTRLTPELRGFLDDYLRTTPSAQSMLNAVPAPLAIYAAFRPVPIPEGLAVAAATGALPWLASAASAAPTVANQDSATTLLPEQNGQGATETFSSAAPEQASGSPYGYGPDGQTAITPVVPPTGYNTHPYGAGGYDPYNFDQNAGYSAPPSGSGAIDGTQMLDIPVRQRVVESQSVAFVPPQRPPPRGPHPLAILGAVGGALVVIIGALVIFLSRDASQANARVTATVGASATPSVVVSVVPDALLTSTAISLNRVLTATALAATSTAIPAIIPPVLPPVLPPLSPTAVPQSVVTGVVMGGTPSGSPIASLPADIPAVIVTLPPRITQAPIETPAPRVTSIPTRPIGTQVAPTIIATARGTGVATVISTSAPTVVRTAAPTTAATAVVIAPPATVAPTLPAATATTVKPAATTTTAPAASATVGVAKQMAIPTPNTPLVSASSSFVTIGTSDSGSTTLTNKSAATTFTATSNNSHITVSPASGNLAAGGSAGLTVMVNREGLAAGPYSGAVNVTTGNGNVVIFISFTVA